MRTFAVVCASILECATLLSCASSRPVASGDRFPAQAAEGPPPLTVSRDLWVYGWTRKPAALKSPVGYVERQLEHARTCIDKLGDSKDAAPGCEGEGLAAGPGLYTCDNPFTSHDYGSIALILHVQADHKAIGLQTGSYRLAPGSGGIDRATAAMTKYEGFIYDFRASDYNTRALVIRSQDLIDVNATRAVDAQPKVRRRFRDHAAFACKADTPVDGVLRAWADQLDFLALTYNSFADPSGQGFVTDAGVLNSSAAAAALASDIVARPDRDLESLAERLKGKYPEIQDSLNRCNETDTATLRACLAQRIYVSLVGDRGTPESPTNAWKLSTIRLALVDLGLATSKEVGSLTTGPKLLAFVFQLFRSERQQMARAYEAYNCMRSVKARVQANNFEQWGADPN